jgi:hypothetical protein
MLEKYYGCDNNTPRKPAPVEKTEGAYDMLMEREGISWYITPPLP